MKFNHADDCRPGLCYYGRDDCQVAARSPSSTDHPTKVAIMVDTTVENLATMLRRDLNHDELLALIGELDSQIADIDFTVKLINLVQDIKDDLGSGLEGL